MRTNLLFLLLLTGCLSACSSSIRIEKVKELFIEYNPETPNNYGMPIHARVGARMKNGQVLYVTTSRKLSTSSNVSFDLSAETVSVHAIPPTYETSEIPVELTLTNKKGISISRKDTLLLNFKGGVTINSHAEIGKFEPGKTAKSHSTAILFRDGWDASNGENGRNGFHGDAYEVHIWREERVTYVHVRNLTQGTTGKYQVSNRERIFINASGGDGSSGGNGGDGGNGQDGSNDNGKSKPPGDGGNGGNGGLGGHGGNGGEITCILHPSATSLRNQLILDVSGGKGGSGGSAGSAGKPGTALSGQAAGRNGASGSNGGNGYSGQTGKIQITEQAFYIADYL